MKTIYTRITVTFFALIAISIAYYLLVAKLPMETLSLTEINTKYQYQTSFSEFELTSKSNGSNEFTFISFDGEKVYGQIKLPNVKQEKYPVLIGIHAMGRSYPRWFNDSIKDRPTITSVNKITEQALNKGYAVIAIDARFHGKRKKADKSLRNIWNNLHFFGNKRDYENMILNTVIDNRVLIDWIETQSHLDTDNISVAGYSMGGQAGLLLKAVDKRVDNVAAIVPPFIDNSTATVAPYNLIHQIKTGRVIYLYGTDDDVASVEENEKIFNAIESNNKQLVSYDAGHILPVEYVSEIASWL